MFWNGARRTLVESHTMKVTLFGLPAQARALPEHSGARELREHSGKARAKLAPITPQPCCQVIVGEVVSHFIELRLQLCLRLYLTARLHEGSGRVEFLEVTVVD